MFDTLHQGRFLEIWRYPPLDVLQPNTLHQGRLLEIWRYPHDMSQPSLYVSDGNNKLLCLSLTQLLLELFGIKLLSFCLIQSLWFPRS
jgi:hypothetical protein